MKHLLFQLYSPMASWGSTALGDTRPSDFAPSKSAILGIVAASLGIRRDEEDKQRNLCNALGFAVRVDSMGIPIIDYHTVQTAPQNKFGPGFTRARELECEELGTVESRRTYRCQAAYTACIWERDESQFFGLQSILQALQSPTFAVYLGRKSCPPALPFNPVIIEAESLLKAFESYAFDKDVIAFRKGESIHFFWENHPQHGFDNFETSERWDVPMSRTRWRFQKRLQYHAQMPVQ